MVSVRNPLTRRLSAWFLRLGLFGLILLAVLTTVLRLALPIADRYKGELTQALTEQLGYPLRVETMALRLAGWSPRLVLGHVVITNPQTGNELLRLRALELDLDPIASLSSGQVRPRSLILVGADLAVHRTRDGRLSLVGLSALNSAESGGLELFMRQGRLTLTDGQVLIIDDALGGAILRLGQVHLHLLNDGLIHQLQLLASPVPAVLDGPDAGVDSAQLELLADLEGDTGDTRHWSGAIYLKLAGRDLAALVPGSVLPPDLVRTADVQLESWNQVEQGGLRESLNRVGLRGVTLRLPAGPEQSAETSGQWAVGSSDAPRLTTDLQPPTTDQSPAASGSGQAAATVSVDRLEGLVRVATEADGWRLQVAELGLAVAGAEVHDLGLNLRLSADGRPLTLDLGSAALDLGAIGRLIPAARLLPTPSRFLDPELVAALNPRGRLERLAGRAAFSTDGPLTWRITALMRGLGLDRYGKIPGFSGLDGQLRADQAGGDLELSSTGLDLDLRPLFDPPLRVERLQGGLNWVRVPTGGWRLTVPGLALKNPDLSGGLRFTLDLPGPADTAGTGPVIDLRAGIWDADAAQTRRYLPVGILSKRLTAWLTQALVSGTVPRGDLVLRGPLRAFPFRGRQGRYELILEGRDLVFRYMPGWPPMTGASGNLRFLDEGLEVQLDSGRLYETALSQGLASIPDLWPKIILKVSGEADGPFADGLKLLTETPLAKHLGSVSRSLQVDGRMHCGINLSIPLEGVGAFEVDGRLSWPTPAGVAIKDTPIKLTDLSGDLGFTANAVSAETLSARLWGRPIAVSISTQNPGDPQTSTTRIRASARTTARELAAHFPSPYWRLATGDLEWDLGVGLHNADLEQSAPSLAFSLRSELRGLALTLPAPLGKTADQARPLELSGTLDSGRGLSIAGRVQPLSWDLRFAPALRLERGRMTLGTARAAPPSAPGLVMDGTLAELDLPGWFDWWERVAAGAGATQGAKTQDAKQGSRLAPDPGAGPLSADLRIARLDLGGTTLTDARLVAAAEEGGWDLRLDARELQGHLRVPGGKSDAEPKPPLALDLDRLDLKALLPAGSAGDPGHPPVSSADTRRLPSVDLRVTDLRWGTTGVGRLSLEWRPGASGIRVPRILFDGLGQTQVTGNADWLDSADGGHARFALEFTSPDTGPLLSALDYAPLLSPAKVEARTRLDWPGGFGAFALGRSSGRIELDVGPGRLLDIDPGVGRVLGFLNLGELKRRLSLDFTDMYKKGFDFERITARIDVGSGQARLQTFTIDGPSSNLRVSGVADLHTRTYDQTVTVEPSIGTSVALASAVAGGPAVGAAVYLVDRIAGGAIDRLASYQYRMTGPWANPELTRLGWEPFAQGLPPRSGTGDDRKTPGAQEAGREGPSGPAAKAPRQPTGGGHFLD